LSLHPAPFGYEVRGIGGGSRPYLTEVKTFTIFGLPVPHVQFLVLPNDLGNGAAGILGQNVFRISDVEYDLANGVIRMMRPRDCKNAMLAYWAKGTDKPVSGIDIEFSTPLNPHTRGVAYVNGVKIHVMFDTGASTSYLTLAAAKRAGVTPESPGVVDGGTGSGIGPNSRRSWITPFASFKVGDEEVRNTRLRIGEGNLLGDDMLVGADFFLSHRIYVSNSQHKLYFTYNGGPVFNLTPALPASVAPPSEAAATPAVEAPAAGAAPPDNLDAAALARPQLHATRHEPAEALTADLEAADHAAPRGSEARVHLGDLYQYAGNMPAAVAQYNGWIDVHEREDVAMPRVLNSRCWARAQW